MVIEDSMVQGWLDLIELQHDSGMAETMEIVDTDTFMFDQGGIVAQDEPAVSVRLGRCTFSVFLRHTDGVVEALRHVRSGAKNDAIGDHVFIPGWIHSLLLSPKTAQELAHLLEIEIKSRADDIDKAWDMYNKSMSDVNSNGFKVLPRKREDTR
jgi:hypothetical protein